MFAEIGTVTVILWRGRISIAMSKCSVLLFAKPIVPCHSPETTAPGGSLRVENELSRLSNKGRNTVNRSPWNSDTSVWIVNIRLVGNPDNCGLYVSSE